MIKILLVGCGHMGSALLSSWLKKTKYSFSVLDPSEPKKITKKFKKKIIYFKSINEIKNINQFNVIIFAVKPQIANTVVKQFNKSYKKNILYISIVAGKKINSFKKDINPFIEIVRVMPNMAAVIEQSISCLVSNSSVSKKNIKIAENLFKIVGKTIWFKKESDLDKATSISGSGPGYYFLFIECLEAVAKELGFNSNIAKKLVYQTAKGSVDLLEHSDDDAKKLKNTIAVRGGTTEAAINVFQKNHQLKKIIKQAIMAALKKSIDLGKNKHG